MNVKKILATILSVLYLVTSSGATINFHYCIGKFAGLDVYTPVRAKCSNCGMQKENRKGCCNDQHATVQLKKDQLASTVNSVPVNAGIYVYTSRAFQTNSFSSVHVPTCFS